MLDNLLVLGSLTKLDIFTPEALFPFKIELVLK